MSDDQIKIIIIDDRMLPSLARDAGTLALAALLFAPGIWLDSGLLQLAGFIAWAAWLFSKAAKPDEFMSINEARRKLDELDE